MTALYQLIVVLSTITSVLALLITGAVAIVRAFLNVEPLTPEKVKELSYDSVPDRVRQSTNRQQTTPENERGS